MKTKLASALLISIVASIFFVPSVSADQAAWISHAEAVRALRILAEYDSVKHFCAPCGDTSVRDEAIRSIGISRIEGESYWEVQVNGKGVDLAYLYFPKKHDKWVNAAMEAKIDVSSVPKELSRELLSK